MFIAWTCGREPQLLLLFPTRPKRQDWATMIEAWACGYEQESYSTQHSNGEKSPPNELNYTRPHY